MRRGQTGSVLLAAFLVCFCVLFLVITGLLVSRHQQHQENSARFAKLALLANTYYREQTSALGIKGAGEAGTVGALPAAMNAINHALAPLGVRHFEMPASPDRLWAAINSHRDSAFAG